MSDEMAAGPSSLEHQIKCLIAGIAGAKGTIAIQADILHRLRAELAAARDRCGVFTQENERLRTTLKDLDEKMNRRLNNVSDSNSFLLTENARLKETSGKLFAKLVLGDELIAEVVERCAKIADSMADSFRDHRNSQATYAAVDIAAAIRASNAKGDGE